ncbi:tRNA lysidine(34) synthetase TilS [Ammoniphilus oxalaticus]|uniref:tRNA(Ile)-lysidine synthase n=1 Tax=Ammoniphilus oxalaticus TaxID=66863 RepID=A0A419SGB1_9BACL|nr:tRNA lysidine(34) synthetase TilS [Ammoniphilus oxalaticus]RKD22785.1 tRNA lysidine(34) synthetase TilS [Ammoniphilus oxalaticus]
MLFNKLIQSIERQALFQAGDRILVGVSGGVDSMALLDILRRLSKKNDWSIYAAHLNHCFRGEESRQDAAYVARICEQWSIPCKIGETDVPKMIRDKKMNTQTASRIARYDFFRSVANVWRIDKLALAHHANDQAETVLMRVLRGTGIEGLAGIPISRQEAGFQITRPLLSVNKEDLIAYCNQRGIKPRVDSSNEKTTYHRNFLRLEVIPWLEQTVNPSLQTALIQLSEIAEQENNLLDVLASETCQQMITQRGETKVVIKRKLFLNSHLALQRRMVKLIFTYLDANQANIGFIHIDRICEWVEQGRVSSRLELPNGALVRREYDQIIFTLSSLSIPTDSLFSYKMDVPGSVYIHEAKLWVVAEMVDQAVVGMDSLNEEVAMFDADEIKGPLILRNRRKGDRISLLGMKGRKRVKDLLIDQKIPLAKRDQIPILADEAGILWLAGVRRSDRALITEHTKRSLVIRLEKERSTTGGNHAE